MKVDHHAGSINGTKKLDQSVDQHAESVKNTSTGTNFSPAVTEISKHLVKQVPSAKELEAVSLRPILKSGGPVVGDVSLDKFYRTVRQQKLLQTKTKNPAGEVASSPAHSQFAAGSAGISLALGNRINPFSKNTLLRSEETKTVNNDVPLEAQSGQFFSSLIILNADDGSFKGALFAPSDANAAGISDAKAYVKQVGQAREMRNSKSQFSLEDSMLVVRRTAGHMQLKKAGIENGLLGATANNPGDNQVLWGGGFKINRARDNEGNLHSWINVSFNSGHLNHRAPDGMVPEDIQPIFRQAMANISGLPAYDTSQSPLNNDSPQAIPESR
jgi:hypothetical protein